MNKRELLDYLAEKKRITAPVAAAEERFHKAQQTYTNATKKWRVIIVILLIIAVMFLWYCTTGDLRFFYFDANGTIQAGGIGGLILFGGIAALLLYYKITHYVKPAETKLRESNKTLQQARNNPDYQNGARDFPAKFYNYYDIYRLWNFINEGRAESLKEAYNLLETQQFQEDQMAIQEDIRRLQHETANASKVTAAASVVNAVNSFRKKKK